MRYLILTYYQKANGQIDEVVSVAKNLKPRDYQTASVILDFKQLRVVQASMNGQTVPKDFNKIAEYYYQYHKNTIDRLFAENGYEVIKEQPKESTDVKDTSPEHTAG